MAKTADVGGMTVRDGEPDESEVAVHLATDFTTTSSTYVSSGLTQVCKRGIYKVEVFLLLESSDTDAGDPAVQLAAISGLVATDVLISKSSHTGAAGATANNIHQALPCAFAQGKAGPGIVQFYGSINVTTAGSLDVQVKDNTASSDTITVHEGSFIKVTRIG